MRRCDTRWARGLPRRIGQGTSGEHRRAATATRCQDRAQGPDSLPLPNDFISADGGRLLDALTGVISHAAAAVLEARARGLAAREKSDLSPVTVADETAKAIIIDGVRRLLPGLPIVSEEAVEHARPAAIDGDFVLIDPVDGTRELVAGRDEFTLNVAVVSNGRPVLGIIAAPARGLIWRTACEGGAERMRLVPGAGVDAARERSAI